MRRAWGASGRPGGRDARCGEPSGPVRSARFAAGDRRRTTPSIFELPPTTRTSSPLGATHPTHSRRTDPRVPRHRPTRTLRRNAQVSAGTALPAPSTGCACLWRAPEPCGGRTRPLRYSGPPPHPLMPLPHPPFLRFPCTQAKRRIGFFHQVAQHRPPPRPSQLADPAARAVRTPCPGRRAPVEPVTHWTRENRPQETVNTPQETRTSPWI